MLDATSKDQRFILLMGLEASFHHGKQQSRASCILTGRKQSSSLTRARYSPSRKINLPQFRYFLVVSSKFKCINGYLYVFSLSNKGPKYYDPTLSFEFFVWFCCCCFFVCSCFIIVVIVCLLWFLLSFLSCLLPPK